jgi:hypothetical protein
MPRNDTIPCPAGVWTLVTTNNVSSVRVSNLGSEIVWLQATLGAVPPSGPNATAGAIPVYPQQTLTADLGLLYLFPGVENANRIYAMCAAPNSISVSHA